LIAATAVRPSILSYGAGQLYFSRPMTWVGLQGKNLLIALTLVLVLQDRVSQAREGLFAL
jgi:hypothetical protein